MTKLKMRENIVHELEVEYGVELMSGLLFYETREERRVDCNAGAQSGDWHDGHHDDKPIRCPFKSDNFSNGAIEGYVL